MGDFNCKLPRGVTGLTGKYSIHPRADGGGKRLMEIMQAANLSAASTYHCPPQSAPLGQATYRPKLKTSSPAQLDYVLVSNRWLSSIRSCKVEWRHSIHRFGHLFDHGMVCCELNLKIKAKTHRPPGLNRDWLADEVNAPAFDEAYKAAKAKTAPGPDSLDGSYARLTSALRDAQATVPPAITTKERRRHCSQRTLDLFEERASTLQGLKAGSDEFKARKRLFMKEINSSCRDDYREWVDSICEDMEAADDRGYSKGVQAGVNLLSGKKKSFCSTQPARDHDLTPLVLPEQLAAAWARFGKTKFAWTEREFARPCAPDISPAHLRQGDVPSDKELDFCLEALAKHKATGPDKVPAESFRASAEAKADLFTLLRRIWREEDVPKDIVLAELITIYKGKGSSDDMTKYRCIGLLTHAYKVLSTLLLKRLLEEVENFLPQSQAGFRKLRSTRDNIYILATLMDKVLLNQEDCVVTFIDFIAAFDSVSHKFLETSLFEAGASEKSRAMFRAIYSKAAAVVRVTAADGTAVHSEEFSVDRGVIQGDIFSPLCFIIALEAIMRKHGGAGTQSVLGLLIDRLEYADDAALIDKDCVQASERLTNLDRGAQLSADMEISAPKTQVMFVRQRVDTGALTEQDYKDMVLPHKCPACCRGFVCKHGLAIHMGRWCDKARRERESPKVEFEVEAILEARGVPERRFYLVHWKGFLAEDATWLSASELNAAAQCVDDFWDCSGLARSTILTVQGENRCTYCNQCFCRPQDLKTHHTVGCKSRPVGRVGSKVEKALRKQKQCDVQDAAGAVWMGMTRIKNGFTFGYLGFGFQGDGDLEFALLQRMAIARERFGKLHEIWRSKKLATSVKVRIYACAVVSVLTYGSEIWRFDEKSMRQLRGWNARCLVVITGRDHRDETVEPTFDLLGRLRSRRLRWAGHILRLEEASLLRRVLLAQVEDELQGAAAAGARAAGGLLMDAAQYSSVEELLVLARDRKGWQAGVHALLPAGERRKKNKKGRKEDDSQGCGFDSNGHLNQVF
jgi:hypothetical protein